jgi:hypothetical protein
MDKRRLIYCQHVQARDYPKDHSRPPDGGPQFSMGGWMRTPVPSGDLG